MAQALEAQGYDTAAIVSSYVLDRSWGLNRGFKLYYDVFKGSSFLENDPGLVERKAGGSVDEALKWLRRTRSKPLFFMASFVRSTQRVRTAGALPNPICRVAV